MQFLFVLVFFYRGLRVNASIGHLLWESEESHTSSLHVKCKLWGGIYSYHYVRPVNFFFSPHESFLPNCARVDICILLILLFRDSRDFRSAFLIVSVGLLQGRSLILNARTCNGLSTSRDGVQRNTKGERMFWNRIKWRWRSWCVLWCQVYVSATGRLLA